VACLQTSLAGWTPQTLSSLRGGVRGKARGTTVEEMRLVEKDVKGASCPTFLKVIAMLLM